MPCARATSPCARAGRGVMSRASSRARVASGAAHRERFSSVRARGRGKKSGFASLLGLGAREDEAREEAGDGDASSPATSRRSARSEGERCPCGGGEGGLAYGSCCRRFHDGDAYPEDPVTLMRSRFSAYAKGKGAYVVMTTHPDNPLLKEGAKAKSGKVVSTLAADVEATCKKVRFYDLEIVRDVAGKKKGDEREHLVGFRYKCRVVAQKGFNELPEEKHAELSTFRTVVDENGSTRWKFVDGIQGST